jgi:hypothetical protein
VENPVENVNKITNLITIFYGLKTVMEFKHLWDKQRHQGGNFEFHYTFQVTENGNGICNFIHLFYMIFYARKLVFAPCARNNKSNSPSDRFEIL